MVVCTQGEGIRYLGAGVTSVYEQVSVGVGTEIQVPCKSSSFLENSKGQQTLDIHPTHCIPLDRDFHGDFYGNYLSPSEIP